MHVLYITTMCHIVEFYLNLDKVGLTLIVEIGNESNSMVFDFKYIGYADYIYSLILNLG